MLYSLHLLSNALKTIQDSFGISNHSVDAEDNKSSEESSGFSSSAPVGNDDTGKWKSLLTRVSLTSPSEGKNSRNSDGHYYQLSSSQFEGKILTKAIELTLFYRFSQKIFMVKTL